LETARQLARSGHRVILTSRNASAGASVAQVLLRDGRAGGTVESFELDVTVDASVARFVRFVEDDHGGADILINNAAILIERSVLEASIDDYCRSFETNVLGPLRLALAILPGMIARNYGRVVNVSSSAGQLSSMGGYAPPYSISKAALNALTRQLADATENANVLVNCVDPGWVRTDMGGPRAPRSVERGAETIVWCATLPDGGPTGGFFRDRKPIPW
jgi:NAD(P)-dependent dehydrogenase (short-subunit alcohol dehydrogenase family)